MRRKVKKFFAAMLAGSMVMNTLSFNTLAVENNSSIQIIENGGKIYYLADPQNGEIASAENFDVWTSKTIAGTENEDEFEVTLQVGTTVKAVPNDVAVMLVMDVSGSMMNDEDGNRWYENDMPAGKKRRIEYTREAALEFAEKYVEDAGNSERMLSIVEFGNTGMTVLPWTDVNDQGALSEDAREAIESVEVNFTIEANKSYWDEDTALEDFGKIDFWSTATDSNAIKNYQKDYLQSYFESASVELSSERIATDAVPIKTENIITKCIYDGCEKTEDHKHCSFEDCNEMDEHTHCSYEECMITDDHIHCSRCEEIDMHSHIVGCTLEKCPTPDEGPHLHCCVIGSDSIDRYYCRYNRWSGSYGRHCFNPDPDHKHDRLDSDVPYLTGSKYFGSVWAIGTNLEAGFVLARNLLSSGLSEGGAIEDIENVYVVLLSDGNPTWMTDETSTTELEQVMKSNNLGTWEALKDIVVTSEEGDIALAEEIKEKASLYAILYGSQLEAKFSNANELNGISGTDWFKGKGRNYVGADLVVESPESDGIEEAFIEINRRIDLLAKAWIVTDELGGLVNGEDVTVEEFTLNGEYAVVTPATEDNNSAVSWSLGSMEPESGSGGIEDPYIYTLKYRITLNSAKDNVKSTSLAYDKGDSTDGVWTSDSTNLQYFMIEKEALDSMTPSEIQARIRTAAFENTSVKGLYGELGFVKKHAQSEEALVGVGFSLYGTDGEAYGQEVFSDEDGKVTFTNIPRGVYTLKETTIPEGMQKPEDLTLCVSWGSVTKADGSAMDSEIKNWPEGVDPTTEPESSEPESSEPETSPSYVDDDDDDEPETTPTTEVPTTEAPTEPTLPTEPVTDIVPETEPLPYVDPEASPEDIPDEVVQIYYERYVDGDIDLDDIPFGVLGAFFEKGYPMAVLPATGERTGFWLWMMLISLIGLAVTSVIDRKRVR